MSKATIICIGIYVFICVDPFFVYPRSQYIQANNELYNYHNSGHYPSSCPLFNALRFEDWIVSPYLDATYSLDSSIELLHISRLGPNEWVPLEDGDRSQYPKC
jgi:hypothetical protein